MKQKIINGTVIIVIIAAMAALIIPWPKDFNREFSGIKYQLGKENQDFFEEVKVTFKGVIKDSYFGLIEDRFIGYIHIDGVNIYENERFELEIEEDGTTDISFSYYFPPKKTISYGKLYLSDDLDALVIELYNDYNKPEFNKLNGYVIAAPANNREEAVEIVNELVKD